VAVAKEEDSAADMERIHTLRKENWEKENHLLCGYRMTKILKHHLYLQAQKI